MQQTSNAPAQQQGSQQVGQQSAQQQESNSEFLQGGRSKLMKVDIKATALASANGQKGWKVRLPGNRPLSTPAYSKGKIFIGGGFGGYEFYAFDATTGKTAWAMRASDDGPTAAAVEQDRVVFNTESCVLVCADAKTGKVHWERWMGDPLMSQPAVSGGKVYIAYPDKSHKHQFACLDLKTGKTLWQKPISGEIITAPVIEKGTIHLTTLDGTLYQFAEGGRQILAKKINATSAPTLWNGEVYVAKRTEVKGSNGRKPATTETITALKSKGSEIAADRVVTSKAAPYLTESGQARSKAAQQSYDSGVGFGSAPPAAKLQQSQQNLGVANVSGVWAYQGSRPVVTAGSSLQSMHDELRCVDVKTGKVNWRLSQSNKKSGFAGRVLTPPTTVNGKVFVGSSDGQVLCLDAKTGTTLWSAKIGEPISAQLIVAKGWVYGATDRGTLFGLPTDDPKNDGWHMWGSNAQHNNAVCKE